MPLRTTLATALCIATAALALARWTGISVPATPARCDGQRFSLITVPGGLSPYISLSADGRSGPFLLDYGATASTLSATIFGSGKPAGTLHVLDNFSLPTFPSAHFRLATYFNVMSPPGGQLGVIGTDFLSLLTADFSFHRSGGDVVLGAQPCDPEALRRRGMTPVRQDGFFSVNSKRIDASRPNVPVLYLRIGGVATWAQIDTGYDDIATRPSIDINEALYQRLVQSGAPLKPESELTLSTCAGPETRKAYSIAGTAVRIESETGALIRSLADVKLLRKPPNACGGIASVDQPAAQIAASVLAGLGHVVLDPRSETVWVERAE